MLLRRNLAGHRRVQRIRRGHRMPLQLALPLLLLLFLLLEFFLSLLELEIRFCQRITFQAESMTMPGRDTIGLQADFGRAGSHCVRCTL